MAAATPEPKRRRRFALPAQSNTCRLALTLGLLTTVLCLPVSAQYSIDWSTIDGGGGTSTGGVFSVSGTVGQPDASERAMSGGDYSLVGGFWSLFAIQTPGAPWLTITRSNATVIVSWPNPAEGWNLEYATVLTGGTNVWTELLPPYQTNETSLYFTEPLPTGTRFYRLHKL